MKRRKRKKKNVGARIFELNLTMVEGVSTKQFQFCLTVTHRQTMFSPSQSGATRFLAWTHPVLSPLPCSHSCPCLPSHSHTHTVSLSPSFSPRVLPGSTQSPLHSSQLTTRLHTFVHPSRSPNRIHTNRFF